MQLLNITVYQGAIVDLTFNDENGVVSGVFVKRNRLDTDVLSTVSGEDAENPIVSTVEITSETEAREFLSCNAILLCLSPSQCDIDLFSAIKDCGLVFDGGVIVDKVKSKFNYA